MSQRFEELPKWEFVADEVGPGSYSVVAVRNGRVTGEAQGNDLDSVMAELRLWAQSVEHDLADAKEYKAMVWVGDLPGERVLVRAKDGHQATEKLRVQFGKEATISVWNETDASSPR